MIKAKKLEGRTKRKKETRGEWSGTLEELEIEMQSRPPGWTRETWKAVHNFSKLPEDDRAIALDLWREIVGKTVPAIPADAGPEWWWMTDNRRPDALVSVMAQVMPPKPGPNEGDLTETKRRGTDPSRWTGAGKLKVLQYLYAHRQADARKALEIAIHQETKVPRETVKRTLTELVQAGFMSNGAGGTCLHDKKLESVRKILNKTAK